MFWIGILLIIIALAWFTIAGKKRIEIESAGASNGYEPKYQEINLKPIGWIPLALAIAMIVLACFTVVPPKSVGVETFFTATTGRQTGAGLVFKAPWNGMESIDASRKFKEYTPNNPIKVKIGDQGEAEVALAYRYRINPTGAPTAYKDFRNADDITGEIRKQLVSTNVKASLNEVLGTYNPLSEVIITADMKPEEIAKVEIPPIPYATLNKGVEDNLEKKIKSLGNLIIIDSITISYLKLPKTTQNKINQLNSKILQSKNTLIDISIKSAQASANEKLAKSVDNSPNVLVSKCFDGLIEGDIKNEPGFSCWSGGGTGVIIPSAK